MFRVWHKGKLKEDDILVRLVEEFDGNITLYKVDKNGRKINLGFMITFDTKYGKIFVYTDKEYINKGFPKTDKQYNQPFPAFKIWHKPHKAAMRLRLNQLSDGVQIIAVTKTGEWDWNLIKVSDTIFPYSSVVNGYIPLSPDGEICHV